MQLEGIYSFIHLNNQSITHSITHYRALDAYHGKEYLGGLLTIEFTNKNLDPPHQSHRQDSRRNGNYSSRDRDYPPRDYPPRDYPPRDHHTYPPRDHSSRDYPYDYPPRDYHPRDYPPRDYSYDYPPPSRDHAYPPRDYPRPDSPPVDSRSSQLPPRQTTNRPRQHEGTHSIAYSFIHSFTHSRTHVLVGRGGIIAHSTSSGPDYSRGRGRESSRSRSRSRSR